MKAFIILLFSAMLFVAEGHAAEPDLRVKLIGGALKGMANAFIASGDIEKYRSLALRELEGMSEEKFQREYVQAYPLLEQLPENLKLRYNVTASMTKGQVMEQIRALRKEDVHELINSVPDEAVTREFDQYWNRAAQNMKDMNLMQQIQQVWQEFLTEVQRLEKKYKVASV